MITRVQKWGNSQGIRLSKALLADTGIAVGDAVGLEVRDGSLVVTPVRRLRGGHDLRQLVRQIPRDYQPGELDWGGPVGQEAW
jgi:antitoxin MazE